MIIRILVGRRVAQRLKGDLGVVCKASIPLFTHELWENGLAVTTTTMQQSSLLCVKPISTIL